MEVVRYKHDVCSHEPKYRFKLRKIFMWFSRSNNRLIYIKSGRRSFQEEMFKTTLINES